MGELVESFMVEELLDHLFHLSFRLSFSPIYSVFSIRVFT